MSRLHVPTELLSKCCTLCSAAKMKMKTQPRLCSSSSLRSRFRNLIYLLHGDCPQRSWTELYSNGAKKALCWLEIPFWVSYFTSLSYVTFLQSMLLECNYTTSTKALVIWGQQRRSSINFQIINWVNVAFIHWVWLSIFLVLPYISRIKIVRICNAIPESSFLHHGFHIHTN